MYHLVYVSSAVNLFTDADLAAVLDVSRRNNGACGITGMLLYVGGNFIQVLEGEKDDVNKTHRRIANDARHRGLITLLEGEIEKRDFSDWSMGFRKVDGKDAGTLPGYNDFLREGADATQRKSSALLLLDNFKRINK
jgi:hypothetical protein